MANYWKIPDQLNPFNVLKVDPHASTEQKKLAFRSRINTSMRNERAIAALAYDMICSKDPEKYAKFDEVFYVKKKDIFYFVTMGDYDMIVTYIKQYPYTLDMRDEHERTLLYLAARNGFNDICFFLLRCGCNINQVQIDGSTALHAATYYGHQTVVQLLLEYGANTSIRNNFGYTAMDEALTDNIRICIRTKAMDHINILLNQLRSRSLAKNMVIIQHGSRTIAKKILRNPQCFAQYPLSYLKKYWTLAWHGTQYQHLQSIMQNGLCAAGSFASPMHQINPQEGHIPLNIRVASIDNWANAIFISPSIFYAAHELYSEKIFSDGRRWCVLVEVRVKPGSYTAHKQTVLRDAVQGEPDNVEYRVEVKSDEDFILRVESNRNVIVTALIFVNATFLENIDEYYQGNDLFANSEAEWALFQ